MIVFSRLTAVIRSRAGPRTYAQALRVSLVIAAVASIFISQQYFLPFWLIGGLATALWRGTLREPKLSPTLGSLPGDSAAPRPGNYDGPMEDSAVDQSERRLRDEFAAARAQQQRNRMREERLAVVEGELAARAKEVAAKEAALAKTEKDLTKKEHDLAKREVYVISEEQRRSSSLEAREAEVKELMARQEDERRQNERRLRELKELSGSIEAQQKEIKKRMRELRFVEDQLDIRSMNLQRKSAPHRRPRRPGGDGGDRPG